VVSWASAGWSVAITLAGSGLSLGFTPWGSFPLSLLALALLFGRWRESTAVRSAWEGWCFGVGFFVAGLHWLYNSLHDHGQMPVVLALFAVVLLASFLALFFALAGWLQARLAAPGWKRVLLIAPSTWVLIEWLRGWVLTGFPWLTLGYSQVDTLLAGLAPLFGIYGMSLATGFSAAVIAGLWRPARALVPAIICVCLIWGGGWAGQNTDWVEATDAKPLKVGLIQGNFSIKEKWQPGAIDTVFRRYLNLSLQLDDHDLVIWPEAALPVYLDTLPAEYIRIVKDHPSTFVIGIHDRQRVDGRLQGFNAAWVPGRGIYRKIHLVPFGEFMPFRSLLGWFYNALVVPMSDLSPGGSDQELISSGGIPLGITICFEEIFSEDVRRLLPQASVLINISEDGWFGDSLAPFQRLQMARVRALETGRPLLRAANPGHSTAINHQGTVLAKGPVAQMGWVSTEVMPMKGITPFVRWGNWPLLIILTLLLLAGSGPGLRGRLGRA